MASAARGRAGLIGQVEERLRAVPWWGWLILFVAAFALLPAVADSGYIRRVAFDTVLYMLLALGLNVVVGWGGLLDLGYVAFYGLGAYAYALLDSRQARHPPADGRLDPARRRHRRGRGLPRRPAVAPARSATTSRS